MCILIKHLFLVLLTILVGYIQDSVAVCTINSDGIYTFGPNCEYMCHCNGGGACDSDTGDCTQDGCDTNWFGPGCQFRDLAENALARHLDNVRANLWGSYANDGDLTSCSYTNYATARRTISPWWRVWLPRNETIWSMEFVTIDDALRYLGGFKVTVEYVPESQKLDSTYYPPETLTQLCYQHSNSTPTSKTIHVNCDKPLRGNQVRIQLASTATQLVLCDVRINGGRNMAFKKALTHIPGENEVSYPPANVVDGVVRSDEWRYCFLTETTPKEAVDWLTVNLGHMSLITFIRITRFGDMTNYNYIKNYQLYVSNTTAETNAVKVYDDTGNDIPMSDITLDVTGQYVNITRHSHTRTVICEIEVYGDCIPGACGYDCSKECHCKSIEDRISGNCASGCAGRWTGPGEQCIIECGEDQWGTTCTNRCGKCKNSQPCDVETGKCQFGCEDGYINAPLCDTECQTGTYGENCGFECSGNCMDGNTCRNTDGHCPGGCKAGYIGDKCDQKCTPGFYGMNCSQICSTRCEGGVWNCNHVNGTCVQGCVAGWEGQKCDNECKPGFWDKNCEKGCGNCLSGTCDKSTGVCGTGCAAGFKNTLYCFEECDDKTFGINCYSACSLFCKDVCDKVNGTCTSCLNGWKGNQCREECGSGEWGDNCEEKCGMCLSGTCDRFTGRCTGGCLPGYKDTDACTEKCPSGQYGTDCSGDCSENCKIPYKCHNVDGNCEGCTAGKQGDQCDKDCENGSYGEDCLQSCGACAMNESCNGATGHCSQGCSLGYKQSQLCHEECDDGTHGDNCTGVCGKCKQGTVCNKVTGLCLAGCAEGFKPGRCLEALPSTGDSFPVGGVVGGVVAALVVIAVVVLVLIFWRRKKKQIEKHSEKNAVFDAVLIQEQGRKKESQKRENVYINTVELQTELSNSIELESQGKRSSVRTPDITDKLGDGCTDDVYYNEGPAARLRTQHIVFVKDLEAYVKKRITDKSGFIQEFEKLPVGLQHPTSVAKKVGNMGKNRYKALYAYDHSRVVLKTLPDLPDSDYINASFIKGYSKENAYIASQGPTEFNINEFWRMILEKDVYTIVMVTRLVENAQMKCIQYWAEAGESEEYGPIVVKTESEDCFADFTIRRLHVSHEDEPGTVRNVTHFHYIAWPDKDLPRSITSLLHFWYQVRKNDEGKSLPWLVHCSAGGGRTGTFIAIDILYDQGKDQGCLDVFQCVKDLRDQRVCMVQTKEHYRYLYSVLVEALVLPWKPVHVDDIIAVYRDLQDVDQKTGKTKFLLEYETLLEETDSGSESEEIDEMYTSAKHTENRNKNRYDNILAPNDYRPYLFTQVDGCTNYINAVYIPSYCDARGYILTQSPLKDTAVDCCRLLFEQEVSVIVTFQESTDEEVGVYLPDSGSIDVGPFTITLVSEEDREHCTIKIHKLFFESKEHNFTQLVCKQWSSTQMTPTDPNKILIFLQELECIQRRIEHKPVMAQCLNGAERSGLIVVLMNIMERVRLDNEVSIPQIIRQLRIRRQQIIPNFAQFKFCYDMLHSYVESSATYANL